MKKRVFALIIMMCMMFAYCAGVHAENEVSTTAEFHLETVHEEGTFYTYNEDGKRIKVDVGPDALTIKVYMTNCEESNVFSGVIELYYDDTVLTCLGARSETGGTWVANTNLEGKIRLAFSTGADVTEDGIILSAAFDYIEKPEEGDEVDFKLDIGQLCSDKSGDDKYVDYDIPEDGEYTYEYEEYIPLLYGDASGDEKVNTADAVVVLKYSAEMLTLDETYFLQSDVNFDGIVNTGDAVLILKYCVGIITQF